MTHTALAESVACVLAGLQLLQKLLLLSAPQQLLLLASAWIPFRGLILKDRDWANGLSCVSKDRNSARCFVFLYLSFPIGNNSSWQNQIRQHMLDQEYLYVSYNIQLCSCEYLARCNSCLKCFQLKMEK